MFASKQLTVLAGGKIYSGTYCVARDFVSVACGTLRMTAKCGRSDPKRVAEMLLRQLVLRTGPST